MSYLAGPIAGTILNNDENIKTLVSKSFPHVGITLLHLQLARVLATVALFGADLVMAPIPWSLRSGHRTCVGFQSRSSQGLAPRRHSTNCFECMNDYEIVRVLS